MQVFPSLQDNQFHGSKIPSAITPFIYSSYITSFDCLIPINLPHSCLSQFTDKTMGKRSFFWDEEVKRKRRERQAENGYVSKAHQEEDAVWKRHDQTDETRKQQEYVTHYLEWVVIQIILLFRLANLTAPDLWQKKVTSQLDTRSSPAAQLQTLSSSKILFACMSVLSGAQGVSVKTNWPL